MRLLPLPLLIPADRLLPRRLQPACPLRAVGRPDDSDVLFFGGNLNQRGDNVGHIGPIGHGRGDRSITITDCP